MIAVDTNVVVRFLTGDDPGQSKRAKALIEQGSVFVASTVILETAWVLRSAYGFADREAAAALSAFAGLPKVTVEDAAAVEQALAWAGQGLDLADALHLAKARDCEKFATFDRKFAKAARRVTDVSVVVP